MIVRLEPDMTVLRRRMAILKWLVGINPALTVGVLVKVFAS